ncbi:MAG: NUDIX domain-containing protein [Bacteroidia bacterium]|nr:NUDIX domain-containing protein [Bacteroidia bacterium]
METKKFDIGVIVGRFQVDKLHEGHVLLIESVIREHKRVVIFLGVSSTLNTKNNPLDFVARKEMILQQFPQLNVMPIPDFPSDLDWSKEMDKRIRECCPVGSVVLYGSRKSFVDYYHGVFETKVLEPKDSPSGTEVRLEVSREVKASPDFRAGVIFAAYNQYAKVYPTVDVAIIDGEKVLLGKKSNQDKFRFPGGFSDPSDDTYEMAAKREAFEETGLEIGDIEYVGSAKMDDWRYRSEEDKIITLFFKSKFTFGNAVATDDLEELKWFDLNELREEDIVNEHQRLLKMLLNNLKK